MRTTLPLVVGIILLATVSGCSEKEEPRQQSISKITQAPAQYTCPMHPEIVSDSPGSCPTCGMALVLKGEAEPPDTTKLTPQQKIAAAKKLIQQAKGDLTREGAYRCCIEPACDECALDHQNCPCLRNVKAGKPVCNQCYAGWQRGEGREKSIDPKNVKTTIGTHRH